MSNVAVINSLQQPVFTVSLRSIDNPLARLAYSPFLHYSLVPRFKKSILEIQVTTNPSDRGVLVTCFSNSDFCQQETSR